MKVLLAITIPFLIVSPSWSVAVVDPEDIQAIVQAQGQGNAPKNLKQFKEVDHHLRGDALKKPLITSDEPSDSAIGANQEASKVESENGIELIGEDFSSDKDSGFDNGTLRKGSVAVTEEVSCRNVGQGCSVFKRCCSSSTCKADFKCHQKSCVNTLGGGCSVFKKCCDDKTCGADFKCHQKSCVNTLGGGCSAFKKCCDDKTCGADFKCHQKSCVNTLGGGCSVFKRCCDDKTCGADFKCHQKSCVNTVGGGCSAFKRCCDGFSCSGGFKCYHDPRWEGEPCSAFNTCKSGLFCTAGPPAVCKPYVDDWGAHCDINNKCNPALNLECGADFKCHNSPRVEGEACGPGATCGPGLKCLALIQRCIRSGSEEALADTLEQYKDDPVISDAMVPVDDSLTNLKSSVESSQDCSDMSNDENSVDNCMKGPAEEAGGSISYSEEQEAEITSKMEEVSNHFRQRLRFYQLQEYERLGIEPPEVLLDEKNIGFPGIMKIGLSGSACYGVGAHAFVGIAFELWDVGGGNANQGGRIGWFAGGGAIVGACLAAGIDLEFSWVFTDDNIYNAGGHSLGGELKGKLIGGVGVAAAVDLAVSSEGAPFPSIEISVGAGIGGGFSASMVWSFEAANCFTGWNCEPCIVFGDPCRGHATIPDGQCCHPNQRWCAAPSYGQDTDDCRCQGINDHLSDDWIPLESCDV